MVATADFTVVSLRGLEVILCLHTVQDPTVAEWQQFIDLLEKTKP